MFSGFFQNAAFLIFLKIFKLLEKAFSGGKTGKWPEKKENGQTGKRNRMPGKGYGQSSKSEIEGQVCVICFLVVVRLAALKPWQLRVGYVFLQSIELHVLVRLLLLSDAPLARVARGRFTRLTKLNLPKAAQLLYSIRNLFSFSSTPVPVSTPLCQVATGR